jgi:hypothetical protein
MQHNLGQGRQVRGFDFLESLLKCYLPAFLKMNQNPTADCMVRVHTQKIGWGQNLIDDDATGLVYCHLLILVTSKTIKSLPNNNNLYFIKSLQEPIFFPFSPRSVWVLVAILVECSGHTERCHTVDRTLTGSSSSTQTDSVSSYKLAVNTLLNIPKIDQHHYSSVYQVIFLECPMTHHFKMISLIPMISLSCTFQHPSC